MSHISTATSISMDTSAVLRKTKKKLRDELPDDSASAMDRNYAKGFASVMKRIFLMILFICLLLSGLWYILPQFNHLGQEDEDIGKFITHLRKVGVDDQFLNEAEVVGYSITYLKKVGVVDEFLKEAEETIWKILYDVDLVKSVDDVLKKFNNTANLFKKVVEKFITKDRIRSSHALLRNGARIMSAEPSRSRQGQPPEVILKDTETEPGDCWAIIGSKGTVVIHLDSKVMITGYIVVHHPNTEDMRSAPREFAIYGLEYESEKEGTLIDTFTYNVHGNSAQSFHTKRCQQYKILKIVILSNWGHDQYTCLYRFYVYGGTTG